MTKPMSADVRELTAKVFSLATTKVAALSMPKIDRVLTEWAEAIRAEAVAQACAAICLGCAENRPLSDDGKWHTSRLEGIGMTLCYARRIREVCTP